MSKKQVTIIANDKQVAEQVLNFIAQNEAQMVQYIDQRLRSSGYGETDTTAVMDADSFTVRVSSHPEDKGNVFVLDGKKMVEVPYSEVANEAFYAYLKEGSLLVYHRFTDEGKVDKQLGSVKNLAALKQELAALPDRYRQMLEMQKAQEEAESTTMKALPMNKDNEEAVEIEAEEVE